MTILFRLLPFLIGAVIGTPAGLILRRLFSFIKLNIRNRFLSGIVRFFVYSLTAITLQLFLDYLRNRFNIPSEYTAGVWGGTLGTFYLAENPKPNSKPPGPRYRKIKQYESIGMAIYNSISISRPGITLEETVPIVRSIINLKWFLKLSEEQILNLKDKITTYVNANNFNENELRRLISEFQRDL